MKKVVVVFLVAFAAVSQNDEEGVALVSFLSLPSCFSQELPFPSGQDGGGEGGTTPGDERSDGKQEQKQR